MPQHSLEIMDVPVDVRLKGAVIFVQLQHLPRIARVQQLDRPAAENASIAAQIGGPSGIGDVFIQRPRNVDCG